MGWRTPGLESPTEAEQTHLLRRQETWLLVSSLPPRVTLVGSFLPSGPRLPQLDKGGWSEVCAHPHPVRPPPSRAVMPGAPALLARSPFPIGRGVSVTQGAGPAAGRRGAEGGCQAFRPTAAGAGLPA